MKIRATFVGALLAVSAFVSPRPVQAQAFVYPLTGWITSSYWTRVTYRATGWHEALDISSYSGGWKLVGAGRAGTVRFAGWGGSFGNLVIVKHESGYETYYGHSYKLLVWGGKWVNRNENIMYEGSTGLSSGPHVHWELRRWNVPTYMPGVGGNYVVRGRGLPYSYAGLGGTPSSGGIQTNSVNVALKVKIGTDLNVRSGPGTGYSILGHIDARTATRVYVASRQTTGGNWYLIDFDNRTGWVGATYVTRVAGVTACVSNVDHLNVRYGPGFTYGVRGDAPRYKQYVRVAVSGAWSKINYGGVTHWVYTPYTWLKKF